MLLPYDGVRHVEAIQYAAPYFDARQGKGVGACALDKLEGRPFPFLLPS